MCLVRISREGVFVLDQESERGASCTFCIICKILRSCNAMVESALEILHSRIFFLHIWNSFSANCKGNRYFYQNVSDTPNFTHKCMCQGTQMQMQSSHLNLPWLWPDSPIGFCLKFRLLSGHANSSVIFHLLLIVLEIKHCSVTCAELAFFFQLRNMLKTCETTVFLKKPWNPRHIWRLLKPRKVQFWTFFGQPGKHRDPGGGGASQALQGTPSHLGLVKISLVATLLALCYNIKNIK